MDVTSRRAHWALDVDFTQNNSDEKGTQFIDVINRAVQFPSILNATQYNINESSNKLEKAEEREDLNKYRFIPFSIMDRSYFTVNQKWFGVVDEISETSFTATLTDLTKGGTKEIGDFEMKEVAYDDLALIKIGAGFYFSVGYQMNKSGQISRTSLLRFQRLSEWTFEEYDGALNLAEDLNKGINWD